MKLIAHRLPKLRKPVSKVAAFHIIKAPIVTEKTSTLKKCYVLKVDSKANKFEIKGAVEKAFGIDNITAVNTLNVKPRAVRFKGKPGMKAGYKKVYVYVTSEITELVAQ